MLSILAPSKTMDFENALPFAVDSTRPVFLSEAEKVAATVRGLGPRQIMKVMNASADIVESTKKMYTAWSETSGKPALWSYRGDVYKGVKADHLSIEDAEWAQEHLLIMSGLYGVVRPFDEIQRYRLEMKASLKIGKHKDLYAFWGDKLATYAIERSGGVVVNLSSDEYARPVTRHLPRNIRLVTPYFFDCKPNGTIGTVPIYSKMMRGVMARWLVDHRVDQPDQLLGFTGHGYAYDESRSRLDAPAFFREEMKPLVFE